MKKRKSSIGIGGFTLLEAVIATAIAVTVFSAFMLTFWIGVRASVEAEMTTIASNIAQAEMEDVLKDHYDNIPVGVIKARGPVSNDPQSPFSSFERMVSSEYVDANLNTASSDTVGLKKIIVTVYWNAPNNTERSFNVSTLLSKK